MKPLKSRLENEWIALNEAEEMLKSLGFTYGGGWEYDHGYFDYKLDDEVGYTFLRLPFHVVDGELEQKNTVVQFDQPFLLAHKYQVGLDDNAGAGNLSGSFNQFSEPQDPDASIDHKWVKIAKGLLLEAENKLLT